MGILTVKKKLISCSKLGTDLLDGFIGFPGQDRGTRTFLSRKKGAKILFQKKEGGRPRSLVNFDRSLSTHLFLNSFILCMSEKSLSEHVPCIGIFDL